MGSHSGNPASGEQRVPIEQALAGLEVHPLEEGETAIEAFVLVKTLNAEGEATWAYRTTNRLNREELLGALTVQVAVLTKRRCATSGMTTESLTNVFCVNLS